MDTVQVGVELQRYWQECVDGFERRVIASFAATPQFAAEVFHLDRLRSHFDASRCTMLDLAFENPELIQDLYRDAGTTPPGQLDTLICRWLDFKAVGPQHIAPDVEWVVE